MWQICVSRRVAVRSVGKISGPADWLYMHTVISFDLSCSAPCPGPFFGTTRMATAARLPALESAAPVVTADEAQQLHLHNSTPV